MKGLLYALFVLIFLILAGVFALVIVFFLGDPVIVFFYGYVIMYQVWWRGGRVLIEIVVENQRGRSMQRYLNR